jgi:dihydrolipoamide dehydrogenase
VKPDIVIIGSGWAGYSAARQAHALGLSAVIVERDLLGGTCLNRGCIPTKTLVQTAATLAYARLSTRFGFNLNADHIDLEKIGSHTQKIVESIKQGMTAVLKQKGIPLVQGEAVFCDPHRIAVQGKESIEAESIVVATGAEPIPLVSPPFDHKKIIDSQDALALKELPKKLLIIGGGVIGCEFAHIFNGLGSTVTIAELAEQLLPTAEAEIAQRVRSNFKKRSIEILLKTDATSLSLGSFDAVLVCIGRKPSTRSLGLDAAGIECERQRMVVDKHLRTTRAHIYGVGDSTSRFQLAHVAAYEGRLAVTNIHATRTNAALHSVDYRAIPSCIFTDPEIAFIGLSETEAAASGISTRTATFQFQANGMAHILEQTHGNMKLVLDKETDTLVGGFIIGPKASELINVLALAINTRIRARQIAETVFSHPSLSESISETLHEFHSSRNH